MANPFQINKNLPLKIRINTLENIVQQLAADFNEQRRAMREFLKIANDQQEALKTIADVAKEVEADIKKKGDKNG